MTAMRAENSDAAAMRTTLRTLADEGGLPAPGQWRNLRRILIMFGEAARYAVRTPADADFLYLRSLEVRLMTAQCDPGLAAMFAATGILERVQTFLEAPELMAFKRLGLLLEAVVSETDYLLKAGDKACLPN